MPLLRSILSLCMAFVSTNLLAADPNNDGKPIMLKLNYQEETQPESGRFHRLTTTQKCLPQKTAIIVCDVWDSHHCLNAVRRVGELAPRINKVVQAMRTVGATIIHAPSDCMAQYTTHPARKRAIDTPKSKSIPNDLDRWCDQIPAEERAKYPVDQSDGGEDDDLLEHKQWHTTLEQRGRNPKTPWLFQTPLIQIDDDKDFVSDSGSEIWSILEARGIETVLICGVHTNMCVLGRPFGLRQLTSHGKNAILLRDLTDTMYNPKSWPFVNHFSGTDLVVDHIERYVCRTTTSDQLIGGEAFRFSDDRRRHLAIVVAEDEYKTEKTLPLFAAEHLHKDFRVSFVWDDATNKNFLPGLDVLDQADAMLVSVRRRPLSRTQLDAIKRFVESGKPVIGIRTASHAFSIREGNLADNLTQWPEFDAQVFGGRYSNHYGNNLLTEVSRVQDAPHGFVPNKGAVKLFTSSGSLYKVTPLYPGTEVVLTGKVEGQPAEPIAWTFVRRDSGRSFYTSLGHERDFEESSFRAMLVNAIHWSVGNDRRLDAAEIENQRKSYQSGHGRQRK